MKRNLGILIADDHELVRRGIRSLLQRHGGWKVVGEAASADDAVAGARRLRPDVVILDLQMGSASGLEAARTIHAEQPETEILFLTMHESPQVLGEILSTGARGYVSKSDAEEDLVRAVKALARHRPFFSTRGTDAVVSGYHVRRQPVPPRNDVTLTPRQTEIVRLLAEGKTNKEVASTLGISVKTAETHRANLMRRLGVDSLSHLVRYAVRHGLVSDR